MLRKEEDGQITKVTKDDTDIIYNYTDNRLDQITTNDTVYQIQYDYLGHVYEIDIADKVLMTYSYLNYTVEGTDGTDDTDYYTDLLSEQTYGNSDRYTFNYDDEFQLTEVLFNDELQFTYEYDQSGRLSIVNDLVNNKTYFYQYDLTGRVREITDEKGNYTKYNYDDKGNFTETIYNVNGNNQDIKYNYDSDANFYKGLTYSGESIP